MSRRKPSYPQDTNASSGSTSVEPVKLSGNVGFPDPLLLLRQATANSGAVSANGIQAAGSYDLTAESVESVQPVAGDSRHGFDYSAFMHYYNGPNVADLSSTGALTFMVRQRARADVTGDKVILRFGGQSGDPRPDGNVLYQLSRETVTGKYQFAQQDGAAGTRTATFDINVANGAEKHTVGIRRQDDGVTVELIINGVPFGAPQVLAAPPDGGALAIFQLGARRISGGGLDLPSLVTMSGVYLKKAALTDAELLNLHNSMMA